MVMIYIIGIFGTLIFLLCDDISPIIAVLLFMSILVSDHNTTSIWASSTADFYFRTVNLVQIFIVIGIFASSAIYRTVRTIINKRFSLTPIFFSFCALALVMLLNGLFSKDYVTKNLLYGLIMALCFLGIFTVVKDNIVCDKSSFVKVAYGFFAFCVVIVIELIVKYLTTENIYVDGSINRALITFGWGTWNTIGMFLVLCIPFIVYLAGKEKYGFIFVVFSVVNFGAAIMSCSRQSIIGAFLVYPVSLILLFAKGKNRLKNASIFVTTIGAFLICFLFFNDRLIDYFIELFKQIVVNGELSGSGRMQIWREALALFKSAPILGAGFYVELSAAHFSGLGFIPIMAHNTVMELLCACGIVGLIVYVSHRVITCVSYLKNITVERTYLVFGIAIFLIVCLFDNHIFNIFPTIIYSCLIAMLTGSERIKS